MRLRFPPIRSFGSKVMLLVTLTSGGAVLLVCAALVVIDYQAALAEAHESAKSHAHLVAVYSEAPLSFDDAESGAEALQALRAVPTAAAATLYKADGTAFATFINPELSPPTFQLDDSPAETRDQWLIITKTVRGPSEAIGSLQVVFDMTPVRMRGWWTAMIALAVAVATTAIVFLAASRLRRFLVRPVAELAGTATEVSRTQDYSLRAAKHGDDELGQLTDTFNQMLARIEAQTNALRNAQSHFRTAVEAAPNVMIMVNEAGNIVLVNNQAERLFGYSREELLGQPVELLVPERFRSKHPRDRGAFMIDPKTRPMGAGRDLFGRRKDGSEVPVEIGLNPIRTDNGVMVLAAIVDITERKRAESDREQLLEAERAARTEAEHASRMKDEFVATLSHELRTPMSAILGWAQMLSSGDASEEEKTRGLEVIERNARIQTQIIEDLLDMSRIVSGKIRLDVQQVNLAEVIEAALATIRPAAEAKGIRLQTTLDPRSAPVRGDASRLQQVVWNLLSNAIKFTPKGGRVQVALERVNSHVEITVSDTGEGIDVEFLPHLFERFRQADASTTRKHAGLGLGLAIVKQLVELHGGSVRAKSPGAGKGSTFMVALPLMVIHGPPEESPAERAHPRLPSGKSVKMDQPALDGLKILVVDDEPDARDLISRILDHRGAQVRCAGSAAEAMEVFGSFRPDVLVSDIGMPQEDGYSLIRRVRQAETATGTYTQAVALTAFARSEDRTRAMLAGYQLHMAKPVEPAELIAAVASLAATAHRQQQLPRDD